MQIKGAGIISADRASLDIHLEITKINESQPSVAPSAPPVTPPAEVQSLQATAPHATWYQQDNPSFGVETG